MLVYHISSYVTNLVTNCMVVIARDLQEIAVVDAVNVIAMSSSVVGVTNRFTEGNSLRIEVIHVEVEVENSQLTVRYIHVPVVDSLILLNFIHEGDFLIVYLPRKVIGDDMGSIAERKH